MHSTTKVIRACIFILWSVLEVTQRVRPTCITASRTNATAVGLWSRAMVTETALATVTVLKSNQSNPSNPSNPSNQINQINPSNPNNQINQINQINQMNQMNQIK